LTLRRRDGPKAAQDFLPYGFFESHDALIAPATAVLPWPNEAGDVAVIDGAALPTLVDYLAVTFVVSLVGCPVVVLPSARAANGLPVGIQLIGAPGRDADLLALAARIETQCGFHRIEA